MSDDYARGENEAFEEYILRAYREMEPVVQVIFMRAIRVAFVARTVSDEVAFKRANDLIARCRAGYDPTIGDLDAIGQP